MRLLILGGTLFLGRHVAQEALARDGGRRMYGVGDALPAVYSERFRTQIYAERVVHPGVWNKIVVVAREDDEKAILNHALIQSRRRHRT